MVTGAGTGTVLLLRWYWWRINAWSEVSAMVVAAAVSLYLQLGGPKWNGDDPHQFAYLMLVTVAVTTVAWIIVTLLTPPEPREKLIAFYRRVRPAGPGWKSVGEMAGQIERPSESLGVQFVNWLLGCLLIYATLFGIGNLVFQEWVSGGAWLGTALVAGAIISRNLSRANWSDVSSRSVS
jgi:Na+/proline symporter